MNSVFLPVPSRLRAFEDENSQTLRETPETDCDGSAKVGLIGIERSPGALTVLRRELPAEETAIRV